MCPKVAANASIGVTMCNIKEVIDIKSKGIIIIDLILWLGQPEFYCIILFVLLIYILIFKGCLMEANTPLKLLCKGFCGGVAAYSRNRS